MLATEPLSATGQWPRVVLAHGFTQNTGCWGAFGRTLAERFDTLAVDLPGHGRSGHDEADLDTAGRLLAGAGGPAHYVGYSMGGRILLHAAMGEARASIRSLILIGATAGIDDATARAERLAKDRVLAERIEEIGTQPFIDEWLEGPLFANLTDEESCKFRRYENSPDGMAAALRNCGTGAQQPLWHRLPLIKVPVLVIAGSKDDKFTALGQRMVKQLGHAGRFVNIAGGHAVHLENPGATAQVVTSWVSQIG